MSSAYPLGPVPRYLQCDIPRIPKSQNRWIPPPEPDPPLPVDSTVASSDVLPRGTDHGTRVADINHPSPFTTTKGGPTRQRTPQNTRAHGSTATPTLCHPQRPFLQPAQSHKPPSLLEWNRENDGSKKRPKSAETRDHPLLGRAVLNAKKKVVPEPGIFKRARGQYMSSPRCSQLLNHESLAPNLSKHTTI